MINENILNFLNLFDDEYIISLSNKGYLKRAKKDLEKNKNNIKIISNEPLTLDINGNTVRIKSNKTEDITCNCPDSKFCRHRITAILYLKEKFKKTVATQEILKSQSKEEDIYGEVLKYDLASLEKTFTAKKLQKAIEYFLKTDIEKQIDKNSLNFIFKNKFAQNKIIFSFKSIKPLENNSCNNPKCKGQKNCIHKIVSILFYLIENSKLSIKDLENTLKKDLKKINEELLFKTEKILYEIIKKGLTSVSETDINILKKHIFKLHYSLPGLEPLLNSIQKDLTMFFYGKNGFNIDLFTQKTIRFFKILRQYSANKQDHEIIKLMTESKSKYHEINEITLYGIGLKYQENQNNAILKTYFTTQNGNIFTRNLFLSLKSENEYHNSKVRLLSSNIWEGITPQTVLNKKIIIKNTSFNSQNTLSSVAGTVKIKETHNFNDIKISEYFKEIKENYKVFTENTLLLGLNYEAFFVLLKPYDYGLPEFNYEEQKIIIDIYDKNKEKFKITFEYKGKESKKLFDRILLKFNTPPLPQIIFGEMFFKEKTYFISPVSFFYVKEQKIICPETDLIKF